MSAPSPIEALQALIDRALAAQEAAGDDGEAEDRTALDELHESATEDVFTAAAALVDAADWPRRQLGLRVLKELGDEHPFAERTLDLLLPRLSRAVDEERRQLISAIGWQAHPRSLEALLPLAGDRDVLVRYLVAQHLPACARRDDDGADERAVAALLRLMKDADADVRWYATAAFATDYPLLDTSAIRAALKARLADVDPGVADCARNALETRRV
ncbi:MAG TPA: HEAT repeat domain-containing protein [Polyangia bacterium]|nr:HEAT repeat domain-containing protein [Polyangia bacterium]